MAGLTVARQLRQEVPEASVAVVERTTRPLPEACHKVGESSVELASHYFGETLGLKDYLEREHLHKNGLRFHCGDHRGPVALRPEIGPAEFPIVPSYQLDRGKLENDLRAMNEADGVTLFEGESVLEIELGEPHTIPTTQGVLEARWVIDATGRRRILQKKLGLRRESPQKASAAWFRVRERILIDELVPSEDEAWHSRDIDKNRWLSTVHLMGPGYWVWLIPLSTGYTSVGIVANADRHPFATFSRKDRAKAWLEANEPVLAERLEDLEYEDFKVVHDYSYLTSQVLSEDRWACVGEAALFLDPLYSLGSDFLALSNSYAVRCIADDLQRELDSQVVHELNEVILLLARDASRTLSRNSSIFPHGEVFGAKVWWDFFNYWGFMCAHFFQEIWRLDAPQLRRFRAMGQRWYDLNTHAQRALKAWGELKGDTYGGRKKWMPMPAPRTVLADQHLALQVQLDPDATWAKLNEDAAVAEALIAEIVAQALADLGPELAEAYGQKLGFGHDWTLPLPRERFEADGLPRRARLAAMTTVARDLERAVGRSKSSAALTDLLDRATS